MQRPPPPPSEQRPAIIRSNDQLFASYHSLTQDDIVLGRIRMRPGEEHLLLDLVSRGVRILPSPTAQLASRSKCFQSRIFSQYMVENTTVIYTHHDLLKATSRFTHSPHKELLLKIDGRNSGLGVHRFSGIETLYNFVLANKTILPVVIQPFVQGARDIRVVIVGDYAEAYERINPNNFRKNLHCGGRAIPYALTERELDFCLEIMERGSFPWAHIDLLLKDNGEYRLQEINLRGGLKGARIGLEEYRKKTDSILEKQLAELLGEGVTDC